MVEEAPTRMGILLQPLFTKSIVNYLIRIFKIKKIELQSFLKKRVKDLSEKGSIFKSKKQRK